MRSKCWVLAASGNAGSRYSCHLDKGGSQSLIIYLMCDAIFPDFWVICATDGRTSRVGGGSEREEEEEQGGKSRWRCFHRTHSVVQNFGRKWAKTCENKFQWSFPLVTPSEGWKANLKGSHSGDDRILVIRSRYSHHGSNRLITRAPPAETETAPNKGAFSTASFCRAKIVDISINNTQDQTCPIETIMVSKPPLSLSHPLSLLLPLASIRRSVNTGRGPQTPRCVMVSTPRGLLLATLLVLHQPLRTLSRDQPYQSWLVLFEISSYSYCCSKNDRSNNYTLQCWSMWKEPAPLTFAVTSVDGNELSWSHIFPPHLVCSPFSLSPALPSCIFTAPPWQRTQFVAQSEGY